MKPILLVLSIAVSTTIQAGSLPAKPANTATIKKEITLNGFGRLNGHRQQNSIVLTWTYNATTELDRFVVEKSYDGINFYVAGTISGNDRVNKFVDSDVYPGYSHYRIKAVHSDGSSVESQVEVVRIVRNG